MDLQSSTNCKLYKCRSLLACDTGGTVYDYYSNNNNLRRNESQEKITPSERIVYFRKAEVKQAEYVSPLDPTTHLDDDEFNDYENSSYINYESTYGDCNFEMNDENIHCFSVETNESKDVYDVADEILHADNEEVSYDHPDDSDNSYMEICCDDAEENENNSYSEEQLIPEFSPTPSQAESGNDSNSQRMTEAEMETKFESNKSHAEKRKQTYNIKMDSFAEVVEEDKIIVSSKNKRRKSSNKENQIKKSDPFANLKMSSILKDNKKPTSRNINFDFKSQKSESSITSSDEGMEDESYKTRPFHAHYFSSLHQRNDILQEINTLVKLNAEFTNADYLEYVQPREKIVESNMDKLVSPTVEIELSEIMKISEIQKLMKENQNKVDCNGNEIGFKGMQKMDNANLISSPIENAEREFFRKSVYAKKFCFENYFNTSNDSLVDDILFNESLAYDGIQLDFEYATDNFMHLRQCLLGKSYKSVSCTLLETLNEFNQFGGFIEENGEEVSSSQTEEDSRNSSCNSKIGSSPEKYGLWKNTSLGFVVEQKDMASSSNFNFLNKSSLFPVDFQPRYSVESPSNNPITDKQSSSSLKIKIKRVNDENNKYVIDDSYVQNVDAVPKTVTSQGKNLYRYECHDCFLKFKTKKLLKSHVSAYHKGPYDMKCEHCQMKFKKSSAHKKHEPWCPDNVTYKCKICNKEYCYKAALFRHMESHKRNVPDYSDV